MATEYTRELFRAHPTLALEAAKHGPVFVTGLGERSKVILDIEEYRRLGGTEADPSEQPKPDCFISIAESLAMEGEYFEWDPPRSNFKAQKVEW